MIFGKQKGPRWTGKVLRNRNAKTRENEKEEQTLCL